MADYDFDVLVIGAGPGGYVAAIRAAQLGPQDRLRREPRDAGRHLPQRRLHPVQGAAPRVRIVRGSGATARSPRWASRSRPSSTSTPCTRQRIDAVKGLTGGIEFLFKKNKVEWLKGHASFESADTVKVGDRTVRAKNIVIATGSSVTPLPGVEIDEKTIVDFDRRARACRRCPSHLVVIGGGVIGLELGSVWRRLGAKVTVRRVPRPDPARLRRRRPQGSQQDLQEAGHRVPARRPRSPASKRQGRQGDADGRAGQGRRGRDDRGRRRARLDRPPAQHRRPRRSTRRACRPTSAARSRPTTTSAPRSPASGRSATSSPARCSPTRPRTRASRSPRISRA